MKVRKARQAVNGAAQTRVNPWPRAATPKITPGRTGQKLGQVVSFGPDHAFMMTEAAFETLPNSVGANVWFVGAESREKLLSSSETEGWLPVRVLVPGTRGRGRLGVVLEESIEKILELRGACPPGIAACADSDASLSDQLYRARLLGAPGLALAIERLESIANHAGALDAEDSAVLRWWVMTARERPLRIYFDSRDESLGIYTAPTHLRTLVCDAEQLDLRPSTPPPVDVQMDVSIRSMQPIVEVDDDGCIALRLTDTAQSNAYAIESTDPPISAVVASIQKASELQAPEAVASIQEAFEALQDYAANHAEVIEPIAIIDVGEDDDGDTAAIDGDSERTPDSVDCSAIVSESAAEPATPTSPQATGAAFASVEAGSATIESASADAEPVAATPPLFPEAAERWRDWMRMLDQARGPRPLGAVEQLYVNAYVPLYDAAARGITGPEAFEVLQIWSTSFAKSYSEAFDALRLRGKRPMMVLDIADVAHRLGRLHGARTVQLVLVDSLRFDLGLRIESRMRQTLGQQAAMTERLLLWSALPSNTATQLELLGRGVDGLKNFEPPSESNDFVSHGRAAATLRRIRTGARDVMKLDMVAAQLSDPAIGSPEGLDDLANEVAPVLSSALLKFAPRTMAVVFGDHGFLADSTGEEGSPASHGGASPEEVLVPAFAWLVGATH